MKKWLILAMLVGMPTVQATEELPGSRAFIGEMVMEHGFEAAELRQLFSKIKPKSSIIKAISRPAEKAKPWHEYRKIFLGQKRINGGVKFWATHAEALARAESLYGVPAEIIVAILGVETRYGGNVGGYRVLDALATLAFQYPPRSKFFRSELVNFLLLTREENISPIKPIGSYAGAMGLPQFMPSSYRHYAIDFNGDGTRNIWTDPEDAIGSIANYLLEHGWVKGESIAHRAFVPASAAAKLVDAGLKPSIIRQELADLGGTSSYLPRDDELFAIIALENHSGPEHWVALQNFYAITRYNHSRMYGMAVTQLAAEIHNGRYTSQ